MKQIILGTAGHIDHGKTSLIKALTGIDTDRLKEEKLRGITIELGFASLELPSGQRVGIVDVPGHEKFIRNMVAGATGIDIVAMVIAADEGVMPQTKEHLDICTLLDIRHGVIVLSKIDLVDDEWLELVMDDVRDFTKGTFLEGAPIIPVSSTTGVGLSDLIHSLERLCTTIPQRSSLGLFRLPVDRVFVMRGFGTVVTGSLVSGNIHVGETIMIYPEEIQAKVRGIQVHNQNVDMAVAGMRTAINLQGLEKSAIKRGDVVARPYTMRPSYMLDVSLTYLKGNDKPLKNRTRVRFHAGTNEILGLIILLDREELAPGEEGIAQIRLDAPTVAMKDDRFVIRSYSPIYTVGGGLIINPIPRKHKRFKDRMVADLRGLIKSDPEGIITYHTARSGLMGIGFNDLIIVTNMTETILDQHINRLLSRKVIIQVDSEDRMFIHSSAFNKLCEKVVSVLESYHQKNPLKGGMPKEELKSRLPALLESKLFNRAVLELTKKGEIIQEKDTIRLSGHTVALKANQIKIRQKIEQTYLQSGLQPPYFKDILESIGEDTNEAKEVLFHMLEEGLLIKVKENLFFHKDVLERLKNDLVDYLKRNGEINTQQFKEITHTSRKYTIPLIEYFDSTKVTIRIGDVRRLRS